MPLKIKMRFKYFSKNAKQLQAEVSNADSAVHWRQTFGPCKKAKAIQSQPGIESSSFARGPPQKLFPTWLENVGSFSSV